MRQLVIKKCSNEDFWYSEIAGFTELSKFDIIKETETDFYVNINNGFYNLNLSVLKDDCLVIEK